jgi:uncharacterized protein YfaA (DUF2138 family)
MKRAGLAWGAAAAAVAGVAVWAGASWARFDGAINSLGVAMDAPAALIVSDSLSSLPRDLVKAPLLRDLLTEDLVFYYEDQEDRLNLRGALKRLALEQETTLTDKLLDVALDEPAELALWLDGKRATPLGAGDDAWQLGQGAARPGQLGGQRQTTDVDC